MSVVQCTCAAPLQALMTEAKTLTELQQQLRKFLATAEEQVVADKRAILGMMLTVHEVLLLVEAAIE